MLSFIGTTLDVYPFLQKFSHTTRAYIFNEKGLKGFLEQGSFTALKIPDVVRFDPIFLSRPDIDINKVSSSTVSLRTMSYWSHSVPCLHSCRKK